MASIDTGAGAVASDAHRRVHFVAGDDDARGFERHPQALGHHNPK
jgi:hypothetical protein